MIDERDDVELELTQRIDRYVQAGVAGLAVPAPRMREGRVSRLLAPAMGASALGLIAALLFVAWPSGPRGTAGGPQTSHPVAAVSPDPATSPDPTGRQADETVRPSAFAGLTCDDLSAIVEVSEGEGGTWDGGATPDQAVAAFLSEVPVTMPRSGFEPVEESVDSVTFTHLHDGIVKAILRVDQGPVGHADGSWVVVRARSCAAAEFGPGTDFGDDVAVWSNGQDGVLLERTGAEHCGWEMVRTLTLGGRQYVRDPEGVLGDRPLEGRYDPSAVLPSDAASTGHHRGERALWLSADRRFLFVVDQSTVERWPASTLTLACR